MSKESLSKTKPYLASVVSGFTAGYFITCFMFYLDKSRPNTSGFFHEYQSLIGGVLACIAAGTAVCVPVLSRYLERRSKCASFFENAKAFIAAVHEEFGKDRDKNFHCIDDEWIFSDIDEFLSPHHIRDISRVRRLLTEAHLNKDYIDQSRVSSGPTNAFIRFVGGSFKTIDKNYKESADILQGIVDDHHATSISFWG